jgi:hypothetical protein
MVYFTTSAKDLKKALLVTILATGNEANTIHSHALFRISDDKEKMILWSTDGDKIALSYFTISSIEGDIVPFTANPKRIQELVNNSDSEEISFSYDPETKTLKIYASDNKESYISFASFDPENVLTSDLSDQELNGKVNSHVLSKGIKFIQGFFAKSDKDKKFSNLYINNGTLYGSDGNVQVGAFNSSDLEGIPELAIRKQMLSPITTLIEKIKIPEMTIKSSKKYITISSENENYCFGFRQSITKMPKFPISIEIPDTDGYMIGISEFMKKIKRLSLSSWEEIAIIGTFDDNQILEMETYSERPSFERLQCKRIAGNKKVEFLINIKKIKNALNLFQASNANFYFSQKSCTIYSKAEILIAEDGKEITKKPFIAIALLKLDRKN